MAGGSGWTDFGGYITVGNMVVAVSAVFTGRLVVVHRNTRAGNWISSGRRTGDG